MNAIYAWVVKNDITFANALFSLAIVVAALLVFLFLNRVAIRSLRDFEQRLSLPYEVLLTLMRVLAGVFWLIVAMLILSLWGVSVSGLWTLLVSVAAVIGVGFLAVWTMISNVTASLFITIWRPFQFGHTVELLPESLKGRVIDRNMMFTVLREENGTLLHIPNNLFFQKVFRVSGKAGVTPFESLETAGARKIGQAGAGQPGRTT